MEGSVDACFRNRFFQPLTQLFLLALFTTALHAAPAINGIRFDVTLGAMSDTGNVAGFRGDATEAFDPGIDLPEPPAPIGGYLLLYFDAMEGAPEAFTRFRYDMRGTSPDPSDSTRTWGMTVSTDQTSGTVQLTADFGEFLDGQVSLYLYDGEYYHNLRLEQSFEYPAQGNSSRRYVLYIGSPTGPTVKIGQPVQGVELQPSTETELSWSAASPVSFTDTEIELSLNGGESWETLASRDSLVSSITWTTPDTAVSEGWLRVTVTDSLERTVSDEANFTVAQGLEILDRVELINPVDGGFLKGGVTLDIDWRWIGGAENVTGAIVEGSLDGGLSWTTIESRTDTVSSSQWLLPAELYTETAQVRVSALVSSGTAYADSSEGLRLRPEQMSNRSFEEWGIYSPQTGPPNSWAVSGGVYGSSISVTPVLTSSLVKEGSMSARVSLSAGVTAYLTQECFGVVPGAGYTMRVGVIDNSPTGFAQITLKALDAEGAVITSSASELSSDNSIYQDLEVSLIAPAGASYLQLKIRLSTMLESTLYLDHVRLTGLEPAPEVTFTAPSTDTLIDHDGATTMEVAWDYGVTADIISSATLEVTLGGEAWSPITTFEEGATRSYGWVGLDTLAFDGQLRIRAENSSGIADTAYSPSISFRPTRREMRYEEGWHLFALPLVPEDPSVDAVLGDDVADTVLVYSWSPVAGYLPVDTLQPLTGYWMALNAISTLDIDGSISLDTLRAGMNPGWNLMVNPFPATMDIAALMLKRGNVVYSFNEAASAGLISSPVHGYDPITFNYTHWDAGSELPSMQAFWIWSFVDDLTMLYSATHLHENPAPGKAANDNFESWSSHLLLRSQHGVSRLAEFGVAAGASDEVDPVFDSPAPPDDPEMRIPRLLWVREAGLGEDGFYLDRDLLASFGEDTLRQWTAVIRSGGESRLDIDFSEAVSVLPEGWRIEYEYDGSRYLAADHPLIRWSRDAGSDRFSLYLIAEPTEPEGPNRSLPDHFTLASAHPNPFNGHLTVTFGLSAATTVEVRIHNILGQAVSRHDLGVFSSGWHSVPLDLKLATGVYFIEMRTSRGEQEVRRIVLLR